MSVPARVLLVGVVCAVLLVGTSFFVGEGITGGAVKTAAKASSLTCSDTDGGLNSFVRGTASLSSGYSRTDVCSSVTVLSEYYCGTPSAVAMRSMPCKLTCKQGACTRPLPETICSDVKDNDKDGLTDCLDSDCKRLSPDTDVDAISDVCDICPGYNDRLDSDSDGIPDGCDICQGYDDRLDSDSDGIPDGCDPETVCDDEIDNDNDGFVDCADADCAGEEVSWGNLAGTFVCETPETSCSDLRDNDGDSLMDCVDPDCINLVPDLDGDAVSDFCDTCNGYNDNLDSDSDGVPNGCENEVLLDDVLGTAHPETYGNNYYGAGTYNLAIGDGFGGDGFLLKFVGITPLAISQTTTWYYAWFEEFRQNTNGDYFHGYRHHDDKKARIKTTTSMDQIGPYFEFVFDRGYYVTGSNPPSTVTVHVSEAGDCLNFCFSAPPDLISSERVCSLRCINDILLPEMIAEDSAFLPEVVYDAGTVSSIAPISYPDVSEFEANAGEQCFGMVKNFLNIDVNPPSLFFKRILDPTIQVGLGAGGTGALPEGYVYWAAENEPYLGFGDMRTRISSPMSAIFTDSPIEELNAGYCPYLYPNPGHELVHMLGFGYTSMNNEGLNEGLAEFTKYMLHAPGAQYLLQYNGQCYDDGVYYPATQMVNPYASLNPLVPSPSGSEDEYDTGYCFWSDVYEEYGYGTFVAIVQQIYVHAHGVEQYDIFEIFEDVLGEPLDQEIIDRYFPGDYSEAATVTENCINCDMFL